MKLLEISDLSTDLGGESQWQSVVKHISLTIEPGETYCLVGESGSGKSVTALSMMGLLPETRFRHPSGSVKLFTDDYPAGLDLLGANSTLLQTVRGGKKATSQVWEGAHGLEWTVPSPAPHHTFSTPPDVNLMHKEAHS